MGGGLYCEYGTAFVTGCTFAYNESDYGGAIASNDGLDLTVDQCVFSESDGWNYGGAIYLEADEDKTATISNSSFDWNESDYGGAIGLYYYGDVLVDGCAFTSNDTYGYGAIYTFLETTYLSVQNSSFCTNHYGSGLHFYEDGDTEWVDLGGNCLTYACDDTCQSDLDGDGLIDTCDDDLDGDGIPNDADAFPNDGSEWADSDGDGVGDNADPDDDNDGIYDLCDVDATGGADCDANGIDDACETDTDADGLIDACDGDGIENACDIDETGGADCDANGIDDVCETDTDADGLATPVMRISTETASAMTKMPSRMTQPSGSTPTATASATMPTQTMTTTACTTSTTIARSTPTRIRRTAMAMARAMCVNSSTARRLTKTATASRTTARTSIARRTSQVTAPWTSRICWCCWGSLVHARMSARRTLMETERSILMTC